MPPHDQFDVCRMGAWDFDRISKPWAYSWLDQQRHDRDGRTTFSLSKAFIWNFKTQRSDRLDQWLIRLNFLRIRSEFIQSDVQYSTRVCLCEAEPQKERMNHIRRHGVCAWLSLLRGEPWTIADERECRTEIQHRPSPRPNHRDTDKRASISFWGLHCYLRQNMRVASHILKWKVSHGNTNEEFSGWITYAFQSDAQCVKPPAIPITVFLRYFHSRKAQKIVSLSILNPIWMRLIYLQDRFQKNHVSGPRKLPGR